jgi:hypothetical protein
MYRVASGNRWHAGNSTASTRTNRLLRFSFHDVAVWTGTICVLLVSLFQTAPYPGWLHELGNQWLQFYQLQQPAAVFRISSATLYVVVALASLWLVFGKSRLRVRGPITCTLILGTALGFHQWRGTLDAFSSYDAFSEFSASALAAVMTIGTLWVVKLYQSQWASE